MHAFLRNALKIWKGHAGNPKKIPKWIETIQLWDVPPSEPFRVPFSIPKLLELVADEAAVELLGTGS